MTQTSATQADMSSFAALRQMILGFQVTQIVHVAAELGIADLLRDGPRRTGELAAATGSHAPSLQRLLRALAALGVFAEDEEDRFALTPISTLLRSDVPNSLNAVARHWGSIWEWAPWGDLLYSVQTGEPAFDHVHGMGLWEHYTKHAEAGELFNQMLATTRPQRHAAVVAAYDFSPVRRLVDVGGGSGQLLAVILQKYPAMHGVVFDLPEAVAGAKALLEATGIADRCEVVGGDFFTAVPAGGDAYVLSNVIHDWGDAESTAILRSCRRAMEPTARLLLVEQVVTPGATPDSTARTDVGMLVLTRGGRQRTEAEFELLLKSAGFTLTRTVATASDASVIESVPA